MSSTYRASSVRVGRRKERGDTVDDRGEKTSLDSRVGTLKEGDGVGHRGDGGQH